MLEMTKMKNPQSAKLVPLNNLMNVFGKFETRDLQQW